MSINDGIAVSQVPFVLTVSKNSPCKIILLLKSPVQIEIIILVMHHRVADIRKCFHIQPADKIRIDLRQFFTVDLYGSSPDLFLCFFVHPCFVFHICLFFRHYHVGYLCILIRSSLIFTEYLIQVPPCIGTYSDRHHKNQDSDEVSQKGKVVFLLFDFQL